LLPRLEDQLGHRFRVATIWPARGESSVGEREVNKVQRRLIVIASLGGLAVLVIAVFWVVHARQVDHWLGVHTGTINEPGPYYGFWSGFGSDIAEFGILGAIGTGVYQMVKKYNCHQPRCWRVGTHPAAGGQFLLCFHHHPDYAGRKPTREVIERLHRENQDRQATINARLHEIVENLTGDQLVRASSLAPHQPAARTETSNANHET
jgi:hypothetical protein